jgi:hypothetical protein
MPPLTEAQKRAKAKYSSGIKKFQIELSLTKDADLIRKLSEQPSKQKYIKELIQKDLI